MPPKGHQPAAFQSINMKRYILMHEHRYGEDICVFMSPNSFQQLIDSYLEVCRQLKIDYAPELDESITIEECSEIIPTVTL